MATRQKCDSSQAKETAQKQRTNKPTQQGPVVLVEQAQPAILQRAIADPGQAAPADILALQRIAGNQAVTRLIQAKLMVGPAGDRYEQEADRLADQVVGGQPSAVSPTEGLRSGPPAQRQAEEEEEVQTKPLLQRQAEAEEEVQMLPSPDRRGAGGEVQMLPSPLRRGVGGEVQRRADGSFEAGSELESRLAAHKGGGSPLPQDVRASMEPHFGADFSGVRVHTGGEAMQMNRELSAQAFTHGQDIYFGAGKYDIGSGAGRRLLAHELTHVVQQNGNVVRQEPGKVAETSIQRRYLAGVNVSAAQVQPGTTVQLARGKAGRFFGSLGSTLVGVIPTLGLSALAPGLLGDLAARMTFGFKGERQGIDTPTAGLGAHKPYVATDISITAADIGGGKDKFVLRGRRYQPKAEYAAGPGHGKAIILLSGSGGPNENQLEPQAEFYSRQGSTVYAVNYRGYGGSRDKNKGVSKFFFGRESSPYLSEQGLYNDACKIFLYVSGQGFADNNIIIHGYSLGGAVAANLTKVLARQGRHLGGLVLHSSIETAYKAAKGGIPISGFSHFAGLINKMSAGDFDTKSALKSIAQADPNLPIHLMSGQQGDDELALSATSLQGAASNRFANVSAYEGRGEHLDTGEHMTPNQKNFLATLLSQGRNRNPGNLEEINPV
jgi:pimeloyl-ACP methyl ester carboxylesterase